MDEPLPHITRQYETSSPIFTSEAGANERILLQIFNIIIKYSTFITFAVKWMALLSLSSRDLIRELINIALCSVSSNYRIYDFRGKASS